MLLARQQADCMLTALSVTAACMQLTVLSAVSHSYMCTNPWLSSELPVLSAVSHSYMCTNP